MATKHSGDWLFLVLSRAAKKRETNLIHDLSLSQAIASKINPHNIRVVVGAAIPEQQAEVKKTKLNEGVPGKQRKDVHLSYST